MITLMEKIKLPDLQIKSCRNAALLLKQLGEALLGVRAVTISGEGECLIASYVDDLAPVITMLQLDSAQVKAICAAVEAAEKATPVEALNASPVRHRLLTHEVGQMILANAREFLTANGAALRLAVPLAAPPPSAPSDASGDPRFRLEVGEDDIDSTGERTRGCAPLALQLRRSDGTALPIVASTKPTYHAGPLVPPYAGWVEPATTEALFRLWAQEPRVARVLYWYFPENELAHYQQPNLTEQHRWWLASKDAIAPGCP